MMDQRVPETPLPNVGANDEADHVQLSRRFQEHTDLEIDKENRLQASEKIWGSVAHALKAVAEYRGWQHKGSHLRLKDIAIQIAHEQVDADQRRKSVRVRDKEVSDLLVPFEGAELEHVNFYENEREWNEIIPHSERADAYIQFLDTIRDQPPGKFTPRSGPDQRRLARLLGIRLSRSSEEAEKQRNQLIPLGQASEVGFSPNFGYPIPRLDDNDPPEDNAITS